MTEFVAAALTASDSFREAYRDLLFANTRADSVLRSAHIANVTTQVSFPNTTCCPDMILEMSNGMIVACEHKLDALETMGPDDELNRKNRRNFANFWQGTRTIASQLGWKVGSGSIVELYMSANQDALADSVFVSPAMADRFLFRVTPKEGQHRKVMDRLHSVVDQRDERLELTVRDVRREGGKEQVLDVTTSLYEILGSKALSAQDIESRLQSFVEPLLRSMQK